MLKVVFPFNSLSKFDQGMVSSSCDLMEPVLFLLFSKILETRWRNEDILENEDDLDVKEFVEHKDSSDDKWSWWN